LKSGIESVRDLEEWRLEKKTHGEGLMGDGRSRRRRMGRSAAGRVAKRPEEGRRRRAIIWASGQGEDSRSGE